jgi:hypothetical protein
MNHLNSYCALFLNVVLLFSSFALPVASAQDSRTALFRGYRTGYSDGYMAGYRDNSEKSKPGFEKHQDYVRADRAYAKEYGLLEDYRDGYRQGFESGYKTGFERQSFDSSVPPNLEKRGNRTSASNESVEPQAIPTSAQTETPQQEQITPIAAQIPDALIIIPANTELIVEMQNNLSTKESREGDAFQAKVVAPVEIEGAIVEGRIADLQKPGRIKRRAEMQLSFDRIVINQTRWSNMNAMVVEAFPADKNSPKNNVKTVDAEGSMVGKNSLKKDAIIVGSTAGTGATVGAIAGGPVGFAVGAAVGGAFGLGSVLVARGKDIKLNEGQRMRIRTAHETQIR